MWISKVGDRLEFFIKYMSTFLLFSALLIGVIEVFCRYILGISHTWGEEIVIYTSLYSIYLMMGLATRHNEHIAIDFLVRDRTVRFKTILTWFTEWLGLGVAIFLLALSSIMVIQARNSGMVSYSDLETPIWIYKLSFPIGFLILTFYHIEKVFKLIHSSIKKQKEI